MRQFLTILFSSALVLLGAQWSQAQCDQDLTVETVDGDTDLGLCNIAGERTTVIVVSSARGFATTYALTDENGNILEVSNRPLFDFTNRPAGEYRIYAVIYHGGLRDVVGENIQDAIFAKYCFDVSDNYVSVDILSPEDHTIFFENGDSVATTCTNDGNADLIPFFTTSMSADYIYIISDESGAIIDTASGLYDFEGLAEGTYTITGLSYSGSLAFNIGDTLMGQPLATGCHSTSLNTIELQTTTVSAGEVSTVDSAVSVTVCVNDGNPDVIEFMNNGNAQGNYAYVITDDQNIILMFNEDGIQDFEGAGVGVCRVYGLNYVGMANVNPGELLDTAELSPDCYDLSDNYIEVNRVEPEGGEVSMPSGATERLVCIGNNLSNSVVVETSSTSNAPYIFVITDTNNVILNTTTSDTIDFSNAGSGICRVWGLSYTGNILLNVGDTVQGMITDECFDLSDNFITVTREEVDGSIVMTTDSLTEIDICLDQVSGDTLRAINSSSAGTFVYVLTDEDNVILGVQTSNEFPLDSLEPGSYRIWGLSFTGMVVSGIGDDADTLEVDGCFDLSDNFITLDVADPDGGVVSTVDGSDMMFVCADATTSATSTIITDSDAAGPYIFVVTDTNNIILDISEDGEIALDSISPGTYRVWGLSYSGQLLSGIGDDADDLEVDGCFDLSDNFVMITAGFPEGGTVGIANDTNTVVSICAGDNVPDSIEFTNTSNPMAPQIYVITDTNLVVLGTSESGIVDFEGAGAGVCLVWSLSYTGNVLLSVGDTVQGDLTDICYDLSDNFATVLRQEVVGGTVMTVDSMNTVYTCPGDGLDDIVIATNTSSGDSVTYVVTNENLEVLAIQTNDTFNFEGAGEGVSLVWSLAYSGVLQIAVGDTVMGNLSDQCFALSSNFIEVVRNDPDAGMIVTVFGDTATTVCLDGSISGEVEFEDVGGDVAPDRLVVTDTNDLILNIVDGDVVDFANAGAGVCRVYRVVFTGNYTGIVGQNVNVIPHSDECFDVSDNYVEVTRLEPNGGMVATVDGETIVFTCTGDTLSDAFSFTTSGGGAENYTFFVTDTNLVVLAISDNDSVDFTNAPPGICLVWGIAHEDSLLIAPGDTVGTLPFGDCASLSDNAVQVHRDMPDGAMVMTAAGDTTVTVTVGDSIADTITFVNTSTADSEYIYVLTDTADQVLAVLPAGVNQVDFEGSGAGITRVYGISYTGNILINGGELLFDAVISDDCWDISDNYVEVIKADALIISDDMFNDIIGSYAGGTARLLENPISNTIWLDISTEKAVDVEIGIFNLSGQKLDSYDQKIDGNERIRFDAQSYKAGMYFIHARIGQEVETIRLVKQ